MQRRRPHRIKADELFKRDVKEIRQWFFWLPPADRYEFCRDMITTNCKAKLPDGGWETYPIIVEFTRMMHLTG